MRTTKPSVILSSLLPFIPKRSSKQIARPVLSYPTTTTSSPSLTSSNVDFASILSETDESGHSRLLLSVSRINKYFQCPYAFYLRYVSLVSTFDCRYWTRKDFQCLIWVTDHRFTDACKTFQLFSPLFLFDLASLQSKTARTLRESNREAANRSESARSIEQQRKQQANPSTSRSIQSDGRNSRRNGHHSRSSSASLERGRLRLACDEEADEAPLLQRSDELLEERDQTIFWNSRNRANFRWIGVFFGWEHGSGRKRGEISVSRGVWSHRRVILEWANEWKEKREGRNDCGIQVEPVEQGIEWRKLCFHCENILFIPSCEVWLSLCCDGLVMLMRFESWMDRILRM